MVKQWYLLLKCPLFGSKKSRFIKIQEAKGLLNNVGLRTLLSKVSSLDDILFWNYKIEWNTK